MTEKVWSDLDPAQRWPFRSPLTLCARPTQSVRKQGPNEIRIVSVSSLFCGKRCETTKIAICDEAGTTVAHTQPVKAALMAELTWAKLYTKAMHKDLGEIATAIRKSQPTTAGPEMKKSAETLHDQLQSANRTVGELSEHAGIRPMPTKG